jgi:hypothetical protein
MNVFYAISNKTGLTAVPLNRISESVIWDFRLSRAPHRNHQRQHAHGDDTPAGEQHAAARLQYGGAHQLRRTAHPAAERLLRYQQ